VVVVFLYGVSSLRLSLCRRLSVGLSVRLLSLDATNSVINILSAHPNPNPSDRRPAAAVAAVVAVAVTADVKRSDRGKVRAVCGGDCETG